MNRILRSILSATLAATLIAISTSSMADDALEERHPGARQFAIDAASTHDLDRAEIERILNQAVVKDSVLKAISRPAEGVKSWAEYRPLFVNEERLRLGLVFADEHRAWLEKAESRYGVPWHVIVSIIGVETKYGRITGGFRVLDSLATLAFHYPPRSEYFTKELGHLLALSKSQGIAAADFRGSYAGAIGLGQFMPRSYRTWAVDFDDDGVTDLMESVPDAIGSVANYLAEHGWTSGTPVMIRARRSSGARDLEQLGLEPVYPITQLRDWGYLEWDSADALADDELGTLLKYQASDRMEYWYGLNNFYVISRYNRSRLYSRAVWELSEALLADDPGR